MRSLIVSPVLWRVVGGFAVGTVMTLGLSIGHSNAPLPQGATLEMSS